MRIFVAASIHAVPAAASDLMNRPAHSSFIRSARGPLSAVCRSHLCADRQNRCANRRDADFSKISVYITE
jgi:hypothetical protein